VIEPAELGRAYVGVDGLEGLYGKPERVMAAIAAAAGEAAEDFVTVSPASAARLGWGRGKFTAWVAATRAKPGEFVIIADGGRQAFLAAQPVAALPLDADTHRRLYQLGLKTLGDLTALPEAAVTSQFGRLGRLVWRLAAGLVTDPVTSPSPPSWISLRQLRIA
jgi:hypothetical protein